MQLNCNYDSCYRSTMLPSPSSVSKLVKPKLSAQEFMTKALPIASQNQYFNNCSLDLIRSSHHNNRKTNSNFQNIHSMKQYHKLSSRSIVDESSNNSISNGRFVLSHNITNSNDGNHKCYQQNEKSASKRKLIAQILPSKLYLDKSEDFRIENIPPPSNSTNITRRRAADTYSPYGTRSFPSLRQRPTSTDSNLSFSTNSLDYSSRKSDVSYVNGVIGDSSPKIESSNKDVSTLSTQRSVPTTNQSTALTNNASKVSSIPPFQHLSRPPAALYHNSKTNQSQLQQQQQQQQYSNNYSEHHHHHLHHHNHPSYFNYNKTNTFSFSKNKVTI